MENVIKATFMAVITILIMLLGLGVLSLAFFLITNEHYILLGIYCFVLLFIYWFLELKESKNYL